jgi:hypothetical protein
VMMGRFDLSILFIAFPMGPEKRLTTLSVNAMPYEERQPISGARPPGRVVLHGPALSSPGSSSRDPGMLRGLSRALYMARCLSCALPGAASAPPHVYPT